jgi:hypothetical protein
MVRKNMIERIVVVIAFVISIITLVTSVTYYNVKKDELIKSAIESAIVKGIDPMSVRCAFGASDSICLVYAATHGKEVKK